MTRPLPPVLPISDPPCPLCGEATEFQDGDYTCRDCECTWNQDGQNPAWAYDEESQCRSAYTTPVLYIAFINKTEPGTEFRCLRSNGHSHENHVNPEYGYWRTGDPGVSEVTP